MTATIPHHIASHNIEYYDGNDFENNFQCYHRCMFSPSISSLTMCINFQYSKLQANETASLPEEEKVKERNKKKRISYQNIRAYNLCSIRQM